ncbi:TonB-dependent receptor [Sphingomonas sp. SRS2]|uniref:TonB-dependent receptor n=1 Tax=Sphingomonas sp. SRS2 TaxID=133190 RepID=UPI0006965FAE|nr:TonB-dependent receptor [Sphingomonas sp. SRS2]
MTAQRRSENLQRAAISVSAVSSDQLTRQSITTASALTAVVPALQASDQGGYSVFYIRGVGSLALNPFTEPAVAFNLNGVYIARPNGVNGQFFDVERVEVLKGPQGTLYGRNATGGAVNLLSRKPDLGEFNGYLGTQYGNYDTLVLNGALNLPMGPDGGLRLAFQTEDRDGYYRDGTDDAKTRSFRLSMRSQLTPDLSVNIVGDYSKAGGRGPGVALLPLGTTPVRGGLGDPAVAALFQNLPINFLLFPGAATPIPQRLARIENKTGGVMAEITAVTPVGTLTLVPAYRELSIDNFVTSTGYFLVDQGEQRQTSLEARLASDDDRTIRYLLGGYYFKESSSFITAPDAQFAGVIQTDASVATKTAAAFSQIIVAASDRLRITGGLRYTWERKSLDGVNGSGPPAVLTSGPGLDPLVIVPAVPSIIINTSRVFEAVNWKIGVEFDAGPSSLVYANVGTGFKAGGFFFSQTRNSYEPEKVTSYVLGTKNRFFDRRLQLNAEIFLLKYRDQQLAHLALVDSLTGPISGFPTENVGRSTIYGLEAEAQYLVTRSLLVGAQLNYVHSRYDSYSYLSPDISPLLGLPPGAIPANTGCRSTLAGGQYTIDCSGRRMFQSPTWTANGFIRQTVDLAEGASIVAEVRTRFEGSRWVSESYLAETRSGSNTRTDVSLTYNAPDKRWSATAYVNNLENKNVSGNVFLHAVYPAIPVISTTLRPPRTYGIQARYNF